MNIILGLVVSWLNLIYILENVVYKLNRKTIDTLNKYQFWTWDATSL